MLKHNASIPHSLIFTAEHSMWHANVETSKSLSTSCTERISRDIDSTHTSANTHTHEAGTNTPARNFYYWLPSAKYNLNQIQDFLLHSCYSQYKKLPSHWGQLKRQKADVSKAASLPVPPLTYCVTCNANSLDVLLNCTGQLSLSPNTHPNSEEFIDYTIQVK